MNKYLLIFSNFKIQFILCLFIPLMMVFSSCSASPPIKEDKFIKVYVDMLIAQDTSKAKGGQLEIIKKEVLKRYSISATDYNSTINFYNSDPKRWSDFFDRAIAYLEQLKKQKNS